VNWRWGLLSDALGYGPAGLVRRCWAGGSKPAEGLDAETRQPGSSERDKARLRRGRRAFANPWRMRPVPSIRAAVGGNVCQEADKSLDERGNSPLATIGYFGVSVRERLQRRQSWEGPLPQERSHSGMKTDLPLFGSTSQFDPQETFRRRVNIGIGRHVLSGWRWGRFLIGASGQPHLGKVKTRCGLSTSRN
jgi:hypothetical protein